MISGFAWIIMLAVFSGLSLNLILQFGLGLKEIALAQHSEHTKPGVKRQLVQMGIFFLTILVLWLLISTIRSILPLGFLEYVMLFPLCLLVFSRLINVANRIILKNEAPQDDYYVTGSMYTGGVLCGTGLFLTLSIAGNLLEAAVLSLGFTLGITLVILLVNEIRRRSEIEAVPHFLRGGPLMLITLGLLSLVFSSAALMLYQTLGAP